MAVVEKHVVYGTVAYWLGKKAEETKSHKWTCYLRANQPNEDLGLWIRKVVFTLHPSFEQPTRVIDKPPFEVTEHGWGEFDIQMQVHFVDPSEPAVEVTFPLRLYPEDGEQLQVKKAVVHERYDEIVFHAPPQSLQQKLLAPSKPGAGWAAHPLAEHWVAYDPASDFATLTALHEKVIHELDAAAKRKLELEAEVKQLHTEISQLENKMR